MGLDGHIAPDSKYEEFSACDPSNDVEPKAADHASSITHQNLEEFRSIYNIHRDYELIRPPNQEQVKNICLLLAVGLSSETAVVLAAPSPVPATPTGSSTQSTTRGPKRIFAATHDTSKASLPYV
ncbi:hypothetical protein M9H77_26436 [Catharanthus roseus]|uniref:Uncharacterized protein n=1 Tax=Catharanthus roseus TaxID=4058 RepID=A0ACC0A9Q1_CATRO|nr:hypothetical protein M9H77_26436 [Catharanthus roseus]